MNCSWARRCSLSTSFRYFEPESNLGHLVSELALDREVQVPAGQRRFRSGSAQNFVGENSGTFRNSDRPDSRRVRAEAEGAGDHRPRSHRHRGRLRGHRELRAQAGHTWHQYQEPAYRYSPIFKLLSLSNNYQQALSGKNRAFNRAKVDVVGSNRAVKLVLVKV